MERIKDLYRYSWTKPKKRKSTKAAYMDVKLSEIDTYFYEELQMLIDFSLFVFSHQSNKSPGHLLKGRLLIFFQI